MNFKTTIALIICLVAVGLTVWITRNQTNEPAPVPNTKYIDMASADVRKVIITPANDPPITLEKRDTVWQMTTPVDARADFDAVDGLVNAVTGLESKGKVDLSGSDASVTGLDQPNFRVEMDDKNGKTLKLAIGNPTGVGDSLYVRKEGDDKPDLVVASLYQQINKPASGFRDLKMVDAKTTDIRSLDISRPGIGSISLKKVGDSWQVGTTGAAGPTTMPADDSAVSDLLFAVTGLRANQFVAEKADDLKRYGLDRPTITVSFNVVPQPTSPTTAPTTQPGQTDVVMFGRPVDLRKQEYFAMGGSSSAVAKVPASTTQPFDKTALDLRDKKVLTVDAASVETISIQTNKPAATQPTTRAAVNSTVTIARNHTVPTKPWRAPFVLPNNPTSAPTTAAATQATTQTTTVATTAPSTEPSAPLAKWVITSDPKSNADEATVEGLVTMLSPLRAEKFLAKSPTTQPTDQYTLTITTAGANPATYTINITDPGGTANPIAEYNGLTFEVNRGMVDKLTGKFEASAHPPGAAVGPAGPGGELLSPQPGSPPPGSPTP
jgi:hypothetical protein